MTDVIDDATFERVLDAARKAGTDAGKGSVSHIIDGNTSVEAMQRLRQGIDDGDPEVMDGLPYPDLSGQWVDEPTVQDVVRAAFDEADVDYDAAGDPGVVDDKVIDAFTEAFTEARDAELARVLAIHLED